MTKQQQLSLLDGQDLLAPVTCDPRVPEEDRPRLTKQCAAILERLQRGPILNRDLANFCLNPRARISDLRKAGHNIVCERLGGGLSRYTLLNKQGDSA